MTTSPAVVRDRWLSKGVLALAAVVVLLFAVLIVIFVRSALGGGTSNQTLDSAISDLRAKIRENPDDPALRVQLADQYLQKQDWQAALDQTQQVLAADENYLGALADQGVAYRGLGRWDDAAASLERLVELTRDNENLANDPRLQSVHYFLSDIYLHTGDGQKALEHGQAAFLINPSDSDTILLIGKAEVLLGDYEAAVSAFETALKFDPEYTDVYAALEDAANRQPNAQKAAYAAGVRSVLQGDLSAGVQKLEEVTAGDWTDQGALARALWGLGYGYAKLGRNDDAMNAFSRAVDADPNNYAAQAALATLKQQTQAQTQ